MFYMGYINDLILANITILFFTHSMAIKCTSQFAQDHRNPLFGKVNQELCVRENQFSALLQNSQHIQVHVTKIYTSIPLKLHAFIRALWRTS